ncbi:unnamed protein product [Trichogramma brassicae]|uniref:Uncharacterized protein n=1 Tax=Trichogramma brassicae TaxID=86971 RepID=A0A6H5ID08_9HYME|nr:unnamed protein product [Trichogramma brassicae]
MSSRLGLISRLDFKEALSRQAFLQCEVSYCVVLYAMRSSPCAARCPRSREVRTTNGRHDENDDGGGAIHSKRARFDQTLIHDDRDDIYMRTTTTTRRPSCAITSIYTISVLQRNSLVKINLIVRSSLAMTLFIEARYHAQLQCYARSPCLGPRVIPNFESSEQTIGASTQHHHRHEILRIGLLVSTSRVLHSNIRTTPIYTPDARGQ